MIFTDASTQGWGANMGFPDLWARTDLRCLELKTVMLALHHWAPVLQGRPGNDRYRQDYDSVLYQQAGGTYSHSLLCLVVDPFLWLQSQGWPN